MTSINDARIVGELLTNSKDFDLTNVRNDTILAKIAWTVLINSAT